MKLDENREAMMLEMFKDHALEVIEEYDIKTGCGEYRWGKPKSSMYEMYILFRPHTIITYGDMGAYVMRQSGIDLPWLRGGIRDPRYLFEKIADHQEGYDAEATKEMADETFAIQIEGGKLPSDEMKRITEEIVSTDWSSEEDALYFFEDVLGVDSAYEYLSYSWRVTGFEWIWIGLRTFLKALDSRGEVNES